ncbi:hypothetical protein JCM8547_008737 [Rhodosporidiobolus lusitaniae]
MRLAGSAGLVSAVLLGNAALVAAQNSTFSSSSNSTSKVVTTISLPPLYECQSSTWTYTAPTGAKYLGFYVSGTSSWIETYALPSVYDDRTNGTFTWKCDLPAGLSVAAQFYVLQDGATSTDGNQASTTDAIINAGSSTGCLGSNDPDAQTTILSLASSLDPSFTFSSDGSSASSPASADNDDGGSTNIGAIVGGVVGGVCGIAIVALALIYLKRKHDLAVANNGDGLSMYSGRAPSEKRGSMHQSRYAGSSSGMNVPPNGTYYAHDEHGNTILMMGYPPREEEQQPYTPPATAAPTEPSVLGLMSPAPKVTAAPGMLPEPMDESAPSPSNQHPGGLSAPAPPTPSASAATDYVSAPSSTGGGEHFTPRSERDAFLGHHGLDDPSSFAPSRAR